MRSAPPAPLAALAELIDRTEGDGRSHLLVHLGAAVGGEVALAVMPVPTDLHPFAVLAGFTAPAHWCAFGIRARGRARHLDLPAAEPAASTITFLTDRDGREASVLRIDGTVTDVAGPAEGTVPDLCRRVLGRPTPPPPPSTAPLWTAIWLERVAEAWGQPGRRRALMSSWGEVAALHPVFDAVDGNDDEVGSEPGRLLPAALAHAGRHPWAAVRTRPDPLPLPGGPLPPAVARWMDDGFFARWSIGSFPPIDRQASELRGLLGDPLGLRLRETAHALCN